MKTAQDPRHLRRIKTFKSLFARSFTDQGHFNDLSNKVEEKQEELDKIIKKSATEWPLEQINKTDIAILRLAVYELLYEPDTPTKVIIDEAIEIAKRYGSVSSGSFINGALASALKLTKRDIKPEK
jgi:transcription antitermination protein NusB